MTGAREIAPAAVLVSWVSLNHRAAPLLTALQDKQSPLYGRAHKLYLCWRQAKGDDAERERTALCETQDQLREAFDSASLQIEPVPWKTQAPPTDHAAIRPFAEGVLGRVRKLHPEAHLYIHVSPGTPAMHAVWLVLATTGFVEGPVTLIETADERGRKAGLPPVSRVRFELDTYLRRYRAQQPARAGEDDDGRLWDPARIRSTALRGVCRQIERWAPLRVPVLLLGERGTGKTTLAHYLRALSPYQCHQEGGWPVVVCGQFRINPQLARSELFGHVKGAFTGAEADRVGLLEKADGDTLFLDEIADIDGDTQRLLMAALEGRGFNRLGDSTIRHSRFRLVAATNRPLEALVGQTLDQDFFDRVAVARVHIPPLRECQEDLPELWQSVLRRATRLSDVSADAWQEYLEDRQILDAIRMSPLRSNLRDLQRAAVHLLAALVAGDARAAVVECAVGALEHGSIGASLPALEDLRARLPLSDGLPHHLEAYRRRWLEAALSQAGGNQSEAARLLGVKRETLRDWLKEP